MRPGGWKNPFRRETRRDFGWIVADYSSRATDFVLETIAILSWNFRTLKPGLVLVAGSLMYAATTGPVAELFAAEAARGWNWRLVGLVLSLLVFTHLFFCAEYGVRGPLAGHHPGEMPSWFTNPWAKGLRAVMAYFLYSAPWLAACVGFSSAATSMSALSADLERVVEQLGPEADTLDMPIADARAAADLATLFAIMVAAVGFFIVVVFYRRLRIIGDESRKNISFFWPVAWACGAVFAFIGPAAAFFAPFQYFDIVQWAGAVTPVVLAAQFILVAVFVVAIIARRIGASTGVIYVVFIAVAIGAQQLAGVVPRPDVGLEIVDGDERRDATATIEESEVSALEAAFLQWIEARGDAWRAAGCDEPMPVFIMAARGGGAYAAGLSSAMLERLDALSTNGDSSCAGVQFSEQLFAVVGVSGGAVGAAMQRIADRDGGESVHEEVIDALDAEHLSAVAAFLPIDVLRQFMFWTPLNELDARTRAWALERSLTRAILAGHAEDPTFYDLTLDDGPVLVFNTTSSGFGLRVAHSPISLSRYGDGTLFSFRDFSEQVRPLDADEIESVGLMRAAIAAARFPLISPAYTVASAEGAARFNFLDGGFSDSTAALTALELFEGIEAAASNTNVRFDAHLILVSDLALADPDRDVRGSSFSDVGAPIRAMFQIRSLLSRLGVVRVIDAFRDREALSRLHIVELDRENIELPLTWRLSRPRLDSIEPMLGDPDIALAFERDRDRGALHPTADSVLNNSCVLLRLQNLLQGRSWLRPPLACECAGVDRAVAEGRCAAPLAAGAPADFDLPDGEIAPDPANE